jgi:hypothetical protein
MTWEGGLWNPNSGTRGHERRLIYDTPETVAADIHVDRAVGRGLDSPVAGSPTTHASTTAESQPRRSSRIVLSINWTVDDAILEKT